MEVESTGEMGPERILPNSEEELGQERLSDGGVAEVGGEWSGEDAEEDEGGMGDDEDGGGGGYYYQPLNQDPDGMSNPYQPDHSEEIGSHAEQLQDVQERIEAMGLYLPQPPPRTVTRRMTLRALPPGTAVAPFPWTQELWDWASEYYLTQRIHSLAWPTLRNDHVELVKRTMAAVNLPTLGIPAWAREISDDQWKDMVQQTLQSRQSSAGLRLQRK